MRSTTRLAIYSACAVTLGLVVPGVWCSNTTAGASEPVGDNLKANARTLLLQEAANAALDLSASSVQTLAMRTPDAGHVSTTIEVDGQLWTLELDKHSVRSANFQVLVQIDEKGTLVQVQPPPIQTYRGGVRELPDADVRASFIDGQLKAIIYTSQGEYGIEPLDKAGVTAEADEYAIYRAQDALNSAGYTCGTTHAHQVGPLDPSDHRPPSAASSATGLKVCELGVDADYQFYLKNGSSVVNTVQDMEDIVNGMKPIYQVPEIGITYEVTTAIVRTVSGTYTTNDAGDLLNQFRAVWTSTPESDIHRDAAHLFTGKNMAGSTIGIAWVGVICHSTGGYGYGLSESRYGGGWTYRVALTAHEVGHNWSAIHCDGHADGCKIMCSGIGGCGSVTSFAPLSVNDIRSYRDHPETSCLSDLAGPLTMPFFEDFPSTSLDPAVWSYNQGGMVSAGATNEPSGDYSLHLSAVGSGQYQDDEIRSNFMLLGETALVELSYYTQHRNVAAGEELVVDYWSDQRRWVELNRITADGTDPTEFDIHFDQLPSDAYHDEFRFRFRTEVDSTTDDWFIDDIKLTQDCNANGVFDLCDTDCGPSGGECDVPGCGLASDCNENLIPDECETDCNANGTPDDCDVADETSPDCNENLNPDECDIDDLTSPDCNQNEVPDECDIDDLTSPDCNENDVPDECDIDDLTSPDCNENDVPDECDVANQTSPDCDENGVPDDCDIAQGTRQDCQGNGVPDLCDITAKTSLDCGQATNCFTIRLDETGCDYAPLEQAVCTGDVGCCNNRWDSICVMLAQIWTPCEPPSTAGNLVPDECEISCQVPGDCDDGDECTDNECNLEGLCRFPSAYDPETTCCDTVTGTQTPIDDQSVCTVDECDPETGIVTHTSLPDGPIPSCGLADPCHSAECIAGVCDSTLIRYGDVDANGTISIFDVFCILNAFGGVFEECSFNDVDIEPCEGNGSINVFDLFGVLNAFGGVDPCCQ